MRIGGIVRRSSRGPPLDGADLHAVAIPRVRLRLEIGALHIEIGGVRMPAASVAIPFFVLSAKDMLGALFGEVKGRIDLSAPFARGDYRPSVCLR